MNVIKSKSQDEALISLKNELDKLIRDKGISDFQVIQLSQVIDKRIVEIMKEKMVTMKV
ncbi:aspartyl-phosphate phosphatase Spo0E family protein [Petroclostridium sp. X23]|uniref:aspartyl-phosphate phosphatase Spo0E family protein n=1 Tax=Petroclostridium sp. X23 TaxID=3045146 RepID=UPI0024AD34EA|nr:aspartyl-phosphate phosphatase Spo0E family protein [Petroclostridium sp. X23]WHH60001.1 aspartyl-phosphate phosphatase Spo0E family protein [Petroclostridium sp. X23]